MPVPRKVKGFSKKAAKSLNKSRGTAKPRMYGAAVMTPTGEGRQIGYADPGKTKLPKIKVRRATTPQGRKANRKARRT